MSSLFCAMSSSSSVSVTDRYRHRLAPNRPDVMLRTGDERYWRDIDHQND